MNNLYGYLRDGLELLYFMRTIVLAVAAVYGLKQIRLMKADMKHRSERASKEKAIIAASEYLNEFVPLDTQLWKECQKNKVAYEYPGSVGDFTRSSIPDSSINASVKKHLLMSWVARHQQT